MNALNDNTKFGKMTKQNCSREGCASKVCAKGLCYRHAPANKDCQFETIFSPDHFLN